MNEIIAKKEIVKKFRVAQYFDDHFEGNIGENLSFEEAKKLKYSKEPGEYVSFEIKNQ